CNTHRAAIADECLILILKLIASGMSAKVVVIVENQDFVPGTQTETIEVGRREPGYTGADNYEIVFFADVGIGYGELHILPGLYGIEDVNRGRYVSAEALTQRWIICGCGRSLRPGDFQSAERGGRAANADRHAIHEITAADRPVHTELVVFV